MRFFGWLITIILVLILFSIWGLGLDIDLSSGGGHSTTTVTLTTSTNTPGTPRAHSPWPGPNGSTTTTTTPQYPIDGQVHVFVDLTNVLHDGQLAEFSETVVNGTANQINWSRAGIAIAVDGSNYHQVQIHDLKGVPYEDSDGWYARTGSIASGKAVTFTGKVQMPDGNASLGCAQGALQVLFPGKPNATLDSPVYSMKPVCGQFQA